MKPCMRRDCPLEKPRIERPDHGACHSGDTRLSFFDRTCGPWTFFGLCGAVRRIRSPGSRRMFCGNVGNPFASSVGSKGARARNKLFSAPPLARDLARRFRDGKRSSGYNGSVLCLLPGARAVEFDTNPRLLDTYGFERYRDADAFKAHLAELAPLFPRIGPLWKNTMMVPTTPLSAEVAEMLSGFGATIPDANSGIEG